MKPIPLPIELKVEYYERKRYKTAFDKIDLVMKFKPGRNNEGAIASGWIDAIQLHDVIVKSIEEKMDEIDRLRKKYDRLNRTFRNWDAAWTVINSSPEDYAEYLELRPRAKNFAKLLRDIDDAAARATLEAEYARYQTLLSKCEPMREAELAWNKSRNDRDEARKQLVAEEAELNRMRDKERKLANRIGDDHVIANEREEILSELYPNVRLGYILSSINDTQVEFLPFDQIMSIIRRTPSPHQTEFRRYDYRVDPMSGEWLDLQTLRDMKVFVEDPRLARVDFVNLAAKGDYDGVKKAILRGEDINSTDYTGCTAMHVSAAIERRDIIALLIKAGAEIDPRDKNMFTPLLSCVRRGLTDMVRHLIQLGADRYVSDKSNRGGLYFAVKSNNSAMVRLFLKPETCNQGWTPLHVAANIGSIEICNLLIEHGASIYVLSKDEKTPEQVAAETGHRELAAYFAERRLHAPAQWTIKDPITSIPIWIGDQDSLTPKFATEIDVGAVLYIADKLGPPRHSAWLDKENLIPHKTVNAPADDDDETDESWVAFRTALGDLLAFLDEAKADCRKTGKPLLICDPTGVSTSPTALVAYLMLKSQMHVTDGLKVCQDARPVVDLSLSLRRGLEVLQRSMEEKKLKRLTDRVRNTTALSIAF